MNSGKLSQQLQYAIAWVASIFFSKTIKGNIESIGKKLYVWLLIMHTIFWKTYSDLWKLFCVLVRNCLEFVRINAYVHDIKEEEATLGIKFPSIGPAKKGFACASDPLSPPSFPGFCFLSFSFLPILRYSLIFSLSPRREGERGRGPQTGIRLRHLWQ